MLVSSLAVQFNMLDPRLIVFHSSYLWKFPPEIWRPATSFLLAGGGINMLFDTYFFYHYLSQLEIGHPRFPRKADLIWYLMFVGAVILVSLADLVLRDVLSYPPISARIVLCLYFYHGSWKGGRLPLHAGSTHHSQNRATWGVGMVGLPVQSSGGLIHLGRVRAPYISIFSQPFVHLARLIADHCRPSTTILA